MSERYILPIRDGDPAVLVVAPTQNLALGTSSGNKPANEDRIGYLNTEDATRICISDGHWGDEAARTIADYWINREVPFPTSKRQALHAVRQIEQDLFSRTGRPRMDPDNDRPPEASFVAMELGRQVLRIVSYGDCRLVVARFANEVPRPYYRHAELASWLGAFSMLGLRDRVSTRIGTDYRQ